jgi:hypothetical protein
MCRVQQVALGCSAIRRDAFESLIATGTARQRPDRFLHKTGFEGPFYGFFDEITLDDGDTLSEDYSFCKRWRSGPAVLNAIESRFDLVQTRRTRRRRTTGGRPH